MSFWGENLVALTAATPLRRTLLKVLALHPDHDSVMPTSIEFPHGNTYTPIPRAHAWLAERRANEQ